MPKITAYGEVTNTAPDDLLVMVDVHDLTESPTGTTKKMTLAQLYQPWQFPVDSSVYAAKGDGKVLGDGVTNGTTTFTSASANFTAADTGKYIMVHGANGATNGPLITTITYVSATTVTLGSAAGASVSNCPFVYGTDDTAAISAAAAAAGTYATTRGAALGSGNYYAEIVFGSKIYILGTGPTQTTSPQFNAQIPLPYPNVNGTTPKLVIALTGAGDAGYTQYWESLIPNLAGTCLVSMTSAPSTPSGTFGNQSVVGGPSAGGAFTGGYANMKVAVKGISVWCPLWTNQYAFDFGYVSQMRVQQSSAHIFAPTGVNASAVQPYLSNIAASPFLTSIGSGFRTPVTGNNDDITMDDVTVQGYECGFRVFDHFNAGRLAAIYCDVVMFFNGTQGVSGVSHGIFVQSVSAEVYNGGFLTNGGTCQVDICWDAECTGVSYDIHDDANVLHGVFRFRDPADARFPTVTGAANLKVICDELGPGPWSGAPAVPATTVNAQNTSWRDAAVTVTSGGAAVSAVKVDAVATGATLGTSGSVLVFVPGGHNISLTYASTAPTWEWVLA